MIKILIVPLTCNLKRSLFYQLQQSTLISLEPSDLDAFPNKILEWSKDPIVGISEAFIELSEYLQDGSIDMFFDMLPEKQQMLIVNTQQEKDKGFALFKTIGKEIATIIDEIWENCKLYKQDLGEYESAEFINNGIVLCTTPHPPSY